MQKTRIEWVERTWNPVTGCSSISEGCKNCYANRMATRLAGRCGYPERNPFQVTCHPDKLKQPLKVRKPSKIFVCSMGDLFHEDVPAKSIIDCLSVMAEAWQHTFLILTKRPERMMEIFNHPTVANDVWLQTTRGVNAEPSPWPLPNVWLGVTAENQQRADERIPILLRIPAAVRFVSIEPMLGAIDLSKWLRETCTGCGGIGRVPNHSHIPAHMCQRCKGTGKVFRPRFDWVIVGGETGPGARHMHPDWVRSLRDQSQTANVPFFFKSFGDWLPLKDGYPGIVYEDKATGEVSSVTVDGKNIKTIYWSDDGDVIYARVGKKASGHLLDGQEHRDYPEVHK